MPLPTLTSGLALGLGAGASPGPLLGLVVTTTLTRGPGAGCQVAMSPLLSDLPVVVLSLTLVDALPVAAVAVLSLVGAVVVAGLGLHALRAAPSAVPPAGGDPAPGAPGGDAAAGGGAPSGRAWVRGALVNLANPHPWLFWVTVGAPLVAQAWQVSAAAALAWLVGFYVMLVGSKVVLALAVGSGRHRLGPRAYRGLLAGSGVLMLGVALGLAASGARALVA